MNQLHPKWERAVDEAYFHAVEAVATRVGKIPLPSGLHEVTIGDWELALNTSREVQWVDDIAPIPPFTLFARNLRFVIFAKLQPYRCVIGGDIMPDEFAAQMHALMEQAHEPA